MQRVWGMMVEDMRATIRACVVHGVWDVCGLAMHSALVECIDMFTRMDFGNEYSLGMNVYTCEYICGF